MIKIFLIYIFSIYTSVLSANSKQTIAVLPFVGYGIDSSTAHSISIALSNELIRKGKMSVLPILQIDTIENNPKFQQLGICYDRECAVKAGKIISADLITVGTIKKNEDSYLISISTVDVESGKTNSIFKATKRGDIDSIISGIIPEISQAIIESKYHFERYPSYTGENYSRNRVIFSYQLPRFIHYGNKGIVTAVEYGRMFPLNKRLRIKSACGLKFMYYNYSETSSYGYDLNFAEVSMNAKIDVGAEYSISRIYGDIDMSANVPIPGDQNPTGINATFYETQLGIGFRLSDGYDIGIKSENCITPIKNTYVIDGIQHNKDLYYHDIEWFISFRF